MWGIDFPAVVVVVVAVIVVVVAVAVELVADLQQSAEDSFEALDLGIEGDSPESCNLHSYHSTNYRSLVCTVD